MNDTVINFSACLRAVQQFGYERIYNVCDGTTTIVPWGFFAWLLAGIVVILLALVVLGIAWWNYPYWRMLWQRRNK